MIEEFNENGQGGLRLTDPENDRKMIDMWLRDLEKEKSYLETIERLEVKNRRLKRICIATSLLGILLLLMLSELI